MNTTTETKPYPKDLIERQSGMETEDSNMQYWTYIWSDGLIGEGYLSPERVNAMAHNKCLPRDES
jgi:hypothetical protein